MGGRGGLSARGLCLTAGCTGPPITLGPISRLDERISPRQRRRRVRARVLRHQPVPVRSGRAAIHLDLVQVSSYFEFVQISVRLGLVCCGCLRVAQPSPFCCQCRRKIVHRYSF
uniref:Uncharacterized protein n=1 Tax=Coccolithus braarudii TaxID=221442 RepID=A0A7S0LB10_9EUKA